MAGKAISQFFSGKLNQLLKRLCIIFTIASFAKFL